MLSIYGRPVKISPACPRMQVSESFASIQTPELVTETNAWMADFFGYMESVPDGVAYELQGHTLVMNLATYNKAIAATNGLAPISERHHP